MFDPYFGLVNNMSNEFGPDIYIRNFSKFTQNLKFIRFLFCRYPQIPHWFLARLSTKTTVFDILTKITFNLVKKEQN